MSGSRAATAGRLAGLALLAGVAGLALFLGNQGGGGDAPLSIPLGVAWEMHTIVAGSVTRDGSDGLDLIDVDGDSDLDIVSPYEQSNKVTLSLNPGATDRWLGEEWSSGTLPNSNVSAPEGANFADVDADGFQDIIVSKEGDTRITILFSPTSLASILTPNQWTKVDIDASVGERWMVARQVDLDEDATLDIVAGGKEGGVSACHVSYFESATPRTAASWTRTDITTCGWIMSLEVLDVGGDGDLDIVYSDREQIDVGGVDASKLGVRWLESDGAATPAFTAHAISSVLGSFKMFDLVDWDSDGDQDIVGCRSATGVTGMYLWRASNAAWASFSETAIAEPANVGQCQHPLAVDLDLDGANDLAISYADAVGAVEGVVWLKNTGSNASPTWSQGIVDGGTGEKYDNLWPLDLDGDGDLDLIASEQNVDLDSDLDVGPGLGVVWFENPYITAPDIGNAAPAAGFSSSTLSLTANFTDTSSDADGTIASRAWNFGDGATSTATNPSHVYASAGTYTATLTVTDNEGASGSISHDVTLTVIAVPQDGPDSVYLPADAQDWTDLGLPVPAYWYLPGAIASGNLTEIGGSTVLTATGTATYQVDVASWTANAVQISETANERFAHASGVGLNPSTTSIATLEYVDVTTGAAVRYISAISGAAYGVRITGGGVLQIATNNAVVNGADDVGAQGVIPILHVINRTAGTAKVYTKSEMLTGTYVAPGADGVKAIGGVSATSAAADVILFAMWSGANAEGLSDATLEAMGWTLAY